MANNHLSHASSPYLLQHADNPVEWYPWGEEALSRAATEDKPILLSIGYSACHWCHVMAHESFADEQVAALMNKLFVNIKVDREERPDIDKIYQTAQFLLTQRTGGWPLTMFLTPQDRIPFFGGTYFPDTPRHGLPAFKDLLQHIATTYQEKSSDIAAQNKSLQEVLKNIYQPKQTADSLEDNILSQAKNQLLKTFDMQHGGFGKAPKFPHPSNLELLLRDWQRSKYNGEEDHNALQPVVFTLHKMASGGVFDHISGGFFRYSVDDYWMIPHFEKMLYDNASLLALYAQGYQATHEDPFRAAAVDTAEWIIRDMQSPQGGYYSAIDADSEGEEGKFYTWDKEHLHALLNETDFSLLEHCFALDRGPNFADSYHLYAANSIDAYAQQQDLTLEQCATQWQHIRNTLYTQRISRTAPDRDDKILLGWNALTIKALLISSRVFKRDDHFDSASRALAFIQQHMFKEGRLLASYKDGQARLNAYLDDYAFLLDALLEFLQTHWDSNYLTFATDIADVLLQQFEDKHNGGFYFTSNDHETLIQRPKVFSDEATPSGNGVAAHSLLRLGYLLARPDYIAAAERTLACASLPINNAPMAHATLLKCHEILIQPPETIILRGAQEPINNWQRECQQDFHPHRMVFAIAQNAEALPPALASKPSQENKTLAYYCHGTQCETPFDSLPALKQMLDSRATKEVD